MILLEIKKYGDPILRKKCKEIKDVDSEEIKKLAEDMKTTMYHAPGVGIAATQVGIDKQIFIADIGKGPLTVLNPKIIKKSKELVRDIEGCLSIDEFTFSIKRAHSIEIQGYLLERGERVSIKAEGLLARVFQHEIDHLNGKLIIDHVPFIQRRKALKRLNPVRGWKTS
ncbi:peptide deformylase [Patescibacteria group bacterium AH-259-L07]|nr:peptide deformylase [Patescibacteria group bacterium AH-259-L07]